MAYPPKDSGASISAPPPASTSIVLPINVDNSGVASSSRDLLVDTDDDGRPFE